MTRNFWFVSAAVVEFFLGVGACSERGSAEAPRAGNTGMEAAGSSASGAAAGAPPAPDEDACLDYADAVCMKSFQCNPAAAPTNLGVADSMSCPEYATQRCAELGEGESAVSEDISRLEAMDCVAALVSFDCGAWVQGLVPGECQAGAGGSAP